MALPRSSYVRDIQIGFYHCTTRCVRRAFLYGLDPYSGRDYSHRKPWIENRLRQLTSIFAIDVSSFSVMSNHYHLTARTRPDIVAAWSDYEVARRWLTLCPIRYRSKKKAILTLQDHIRALAGRPERIAVLRKRLSSLSWFMGRLNEFIARAANKEDNVKGRFWESRFKCQALLDHPSIAACMVYVDLNPIRAGLAHTPESSNFTGIQRRIQNRIRKTTNSNSNDYPGDGPFCLCPISSLNDPNGILPMSEDEYIDLVDRSGRLIRKDKPGFVDPNLEPILIRIRANPKSWEDTVSHFEDKFGLAVGIVDNIRKFADLLGKRWFTGIRSAQSAFS
jgi:putative transposase